MTHAPGTHVLLDYFGASHLDDETTLRKALLAAAQAAGATVINQDFHTFPGRAGVTGVVLLAESHISIHTWPENQFAALDIFLCGAMLPDAAIASLASDLQPERVEITRVVRGVG